MSPSPFPAPFDPKNRLRSTDIHLLKDFESLHHLPSCLFPAKAPYNRPPLFHFGYPADLEKIEKWAREHGFTDDMLQLREDYVAFTENNFQICLMKFMCIEATKLAGSPVEIAFGRRKGEAFWLISLWRSFTPPAEQGATLSVIEFGELFSTEPPAWFVDATRFYWNWLDL